MRMDGRTRARDCSRCRNDPGLMMEDLLMKVHGLEMPSPAKELARWTILLRNG